MAHSAACRNFHGSKFRCPRRNQADESERVPAGVSDLVRFTGRDEDRVPLGHGNPVIFPIHFTRSAMEEDFVFPIVGMKGCVALWFQFEDPHAEMGSSVVPPDKNPPRNAFCRTVSEVFSWSVFIVLDLHDMNFLLRSSQGAKAAKTTAEMR